MINKKAVAILKEVSMGFIEELLGKLKEVDDNVYQNQMRKEVQKSETVKLNAYRSWLPLPLKVYMHFNPDYEVNPQDLTLHPEGHEEDTANGFLVALYNIYYVKKFSIKENLLIAQTFEKYAKSNSNLNLALAELGNYRGFNEYQRKSFYDVEESMAMHGHPIYEAMEIKMSSLLDERLINTLRVGLDSHKLEESLQIYVDDIMYDMRNNARIKKAMAYPLLILAMILIMCIGAKLFLVPQLFGALNIPVPAEVNPVIAVADIILYPMNLIEILLYLYIFKWFYTKSKTVATFVEMVLLRIPILGNYLITKDICTFFRYMFNYVDSGKKTYDAHMESCKVLKLHTLQIIFEDKGEEITGGLQVSQIYNDITFIKEDVKMILKVSEGNGALSEALFTISGLMKAEYQDTVDKIVEQIQPLSTVAAALAIGVLFLPVLGVMYNLDKLIMG